MAQEKYFPEVIDILTNICQATPCLPVYIAYFFILDFAASHMICIVHAYDDNNTLWIVDAGLKAVTKFDRAAEAVLVFNTLSFVPGRMYFDSNDKFYYLICAPKIYKLALTRNFRLEYLFEIPNETPVEIGQSIFYEYTHFNVYSTGNKTISCPYGRDLSFCIPARLVLPSPSRVVVDLAVHSAFIIESASPMIRLVTVWNDTSLHVSWCATEPCNPAIRVTAAGISDGWLYYYISEKAGNRHLHRFQYKGIAVFLRSHTHLFAHKAKLSVLELLHLLYREIVWSGAFY